MHLMRRRAKMNLIVATMNITRNTVKLKSGIRNRRSSFPRSTCEFPGFQRSLGRLQIANKHVRRKLVGDLLIDFSIHSPSVREYLNHLKHVHN